MSFDADTPVGMVMVGVMNILFLALVAVVVTVGWPFMVAFMLMND